MLSVISLVSLNLLPLREYVIVSDFTVTVLFRLFEPVCSSESDSVSVDDAAGEKVIADGVTVSDADLNFVGALDETLAVNVLTSDFVFLVPESEDDTLRDSPRRENETDMVIDGLSFVRLTTSVNDRGVIVSVLERVSSAVSVSVIVRS